MTFEILANGILIGHSLLEHGDPPMGVAYGVMIPTEAYAGFRARVIASAGGPVAGIELAARLAGSAECLPCIGVGLLDLSHEIAEPPQVEVLGIPYPDYAGLFPQHVGAYQASFQVV